LSPAAVATYKEAELECRRITAKLAFPFGDEPYEDAYQQAVWRFGSDARQQTSTG